MEMKTCSMRGLGRDRLRNCHFSPKNFTSIAGARIFQTLENRLVDRFKILEFTKSLLGFRRVEPLESRHGRNSVRFAFEQTCRALIFPTYCVLLYHVKLGCVCLTFIWWKPSRKGTIAKFSKEWVTSTECSGKICIQRGSMKHPTTLPLCLLFYAGLWGWHFLHKIDCKVSILQCNAMHMQVQKCKCICNADGNAHAMK